MLFICDDGHDEIAHEGAKCKICELLAEKDDRIKALERQVKDYQEEIDLISKEE